jgi:hypothetical protein
VFELPPENLTTAHTEKDAARGDAGSLRVTSSVKETYSLMNRCEPLPPSAALQDPVAQALLSVLACGVYTFAAFHDLSRLVMPSRAPLLREGSAPLAPLGHDSLNPLSC